MADFLLRDVWAVLAVAVGLDFLRTEEIDSDTGGPEIGAALPPEAIHGLSDAGLRAAESGAYELAIGRVEALELLRYLDAAYVNPAATPAMSSSASKSSRSTVSRSSSVKSK